MSLHSDANNSRPLIMGSKTISSLATFSTNQNKKKLKMTNLDRVSILF